MKAPPSTYKTPFSSSAYARHDTDSSGPLKAVHEYVHAPAHRSAAPQRLVVASVDAGSLAERVGFKLGWGCLCFYPYFYAVGLWSVAHLPSPHPSTAMLAGAAVLFFAGWSLARGANMQKYFFKRDPAAKFLVLIAPEIITPS